jgi:hypothetical protein
MTAGIRPYPDWTLVHGETGRAYEMKSTRYTDVGTYGEEGSIGISMEDRRHPPVEIASR